MSNAEFRQVVDHDRALLGALMVIPAPDVVRDGPRPRDARRAVPAPARRTRRWPESTRQELGRSMPPTPLAGRAVTEPLGFVVLARRPGQPDEIVSAVFPAYPNGLEQAQNVLESCQKRLTHLARKAQHAQAIAACSIGQPDRAEKIAYRDQVEAELRAAEIDPVEYVIGAITERTP